MEIVQIIRNKLSRIWENEHLYVSMYQVVSDGSVFNTNKNWSINGIISFFLYGSFNIPVLNKKSNSGDFIGFQQEIEYQNSPTSVWLILVSNHINEAVALDEMRIMEAMLHIIAGRNIIYEKFSFFCISSENKHIISTNSFLNFSIFPIINGNNIEQKLNLVEGLIKQKEGVLLELKLGLSWFSDSRDSSGIDAFLKTWVAFEAIAMTNTNINSSYEMLMNTYGLQKKDIQNIFLLGKVHGYRSRILHGECKGEFSILILKYFELLVADIFIYRLTDIKQSGALDFLKNKKIEIEKALTA